MDIATTVPDVLLWTFGFASLFFEKFRSVKLHVLTITVIIIVLSKMMDHN